MRPPTPSRPARRLVRVLCCCSLILGFALTGCESVARGLREDLRAPVVDSTLRSLENETNAVDLAARGVRNDIGPWGFWDSVLRGAHADLRFWRR